MQDKINSKVQQGAMVSTRDKKATIYASELEQWINKDLANPQKSLSVPKGYNVGNEVMSAMLYIANNVKDKNGRSAIDVCTKDSIMSAVRDMAIQGLSIIRKQAYPIVYGDQLKMQVSYFGTMASLKNMFPNLKITSNVIHEGDKYEYKYDEIGEFNYIENVQSSLENRDKPIIAAYGSIFDKKTNERLYGCVMTMNEIKVCWSHSLSKEQKIHQEFPQEMAQRTVINRLCKRYINTISTKEMANADLYESYQRMANADYDFEDAEVVEVDKDTQKAIRSKSQGAKGLESLLERSNENENTSSEEREGTLNASELENGETIPEKEEDASETQDLAVEGEEGQNGDLFAEDEMDDIPW